jgi:hypothetical protein
VTPHIQEKLLTVSEEKSKVEPIPFLVEQKIEASIPVQKVTLTLKEEKILAKAQIQQSKFSKLQLSSNELNKTKEILKERPRSHLYFRNLDSSFSKEDLRNIFYEEFEKNNRFKISFIEISQDEISGFFVKLTFEDIQNAVKVYFNKVEFILPFKKTKLECIEVKF